jgi:hypothetical protein
MGNGMISITKTGTPRDALVMSAKLHKSGLEFNKDYAWFNHSTNREIIFQFADERNATLFELLYTGYKQ